MGDLRLPTNFEFPNKTAVASCLPDVYRLKIFTFPQSLLTFLAAIMLSTNLPFELCEIILSYLNPSDLLNCCLVSKAWLDFYNISNCCRRVTLIINDQIDLTDLEICTRRYPKIKVTKLKKSVLKDILHHIAPTVEELEIDDCGLDEYLDLHFPHLKCLSISSSCGDLLPKIFSRPCCTLKCFLLYKLYGPSTCHVVNFLKINKTLEEINFYLDETTNFFKRDISNEVEFKLKSLFISYKSSCDLSTNALTNIEKFLKTQGDTLEAISLINSANFTLLFRTWNCLKVIERLYCFSSDPNFDNYCSVRPELRTNSAISDFELHALGPLSLKLDSLVPFLDAAIRLKSLGVWHLKRDLVEYVARNCKTLRTISCATMESDCVTFYNELKSKIGINDKMQIHQYL